MTADSPPGAPDYMCASFVYSSERLRNCRHSTRTPHYCYLSSLPMKFWDLYVTTFFVPLSASLSLVARRYRLGATCLLCLLLSARCLRHWGAPCVSVMTSAGTKRPPLPLLPPLPFGCTSSRVLFSFCACAGALWEASRCTREPPLPLVFSQPIVFCVGVSPVLLCVWM